MSQLLFVFCSTKINSETTSDQKIENLKAFTKLYGYIRYFHPSDEANKIDWNKFVIYGIKEVLNDSLDEQLKITLEELFYSIAPTLMLYDEGKKNEYNNGLHTNVKQNPKQVAWQHFGIYLSKRSNIYRSQRTYKNINSDQLENKLFDQFPHSEEKYEANLNSKLRCKFPLVLYCDSTETIGNSESFKFTSLMEKLNSMLIADSTANNIYIRLANVVIAWNVFQHFYPYFDVLDIDWEKVLTETIEETFQNKNADDFYKSLSKMIAKLQDGHGVVYYRRERELGGLPIAVEWIEHKIVVVATLDSLFRKGDIIVSLDGVGADEILMEDEMYISGSTQLKRYRALNQFGKGPIGSNTEIKLKRNDSIINFNLQRKTETRNFFFNQISEFTFPVIKEISSQIYYVNLASIDDETFNNNMTYLENAKGIIFDWRFDGIRREKNPINTLNIIQHLISSSIKSANWNVPQIIYPDRYKIGFTESNWELQAISPQFKGKFVFIDRASVVSFGETVMGMVENYKLATIIGETTAATNGNVNFINLLGGFNVMWTGMKVLKHDGTQHHLIGIKPNVNVNRTIKAVIEGRDEYLEKALEILTE